MSNRGMQTLVVMALLFVGAVVAWLVNGGISHTTTRTHERTTVLIEPQTTPLRDSGPRNNARPPRRSVGLPVSSSSPGKPNTTTGAQNRPLPSPKTQRPKTTHKPSAGAQQPNPPPQQPNPPPTQPQPLVGATVPVPAHVCVRPVAGVNC